jgi:outer membrane immunogenic protein
MTGFNAPGTWLVESKVNWLATAALRAGFVVADKLLVYGKGGVAITNERHSFSETVGNPVGSAAVSGNAVHTGIVAGAGAEYALGGNWSIKAEYDYIRMQDQSFTVVGSATGGGIPGTVPFFQQIPKLSQDLQLIKFGVNYHFNPAPVVVSARY